MSDGEKEEGDVHAKREVERKREEIFLCVFFSSSACFFVVVGKWIIDRRRGFYPSRRFFCL